MAAAQIPNHGADTSVTFHHFALVNAIDGPRGAHARNPWRFVHKPVTGRGNGDLSRSMQFELFCSAVIAPNEYTTTGGAAVLTETTSATERVTREKLL